MSFLKKFIGVLILFSLFARYGDGNTPPKALIWYILTPQLLQGFIWIALIILAYKLTSGKSRDYSKFFYNLLVKIFGDPKKSIQRPGK